MVPKQFGTIAEKAALLWRDLHGWRSIFIGPQGSCGGRPDYSTLRLYPNARYGSPESALDSQADTTAMAKEFQYIGHDSPKGCF